MPEDVPQPHVGGFEESMSKLNKLVGLKNLKYNIETHLNLVRFSHLRQQHGLQVSIPPLHMIFTGNPGTGKTTVAGLLGEIYASLGILKTGHVVKVDRKKLVGQYIGDTEENTKRALQQAHGNILFVDEAYTLVGDPDDKRDFGPKALDCLLDELGKENTDMIIILAGYPDEMEQLLKSNKGLQSRFPNKFEFTDFTVDELLEITKRRIKDYDYQFTVPAWKKYSDILTQAYQLRNPETWGNARFIANQLERIYIQHANRCVQQQPHDKSELLLLTPEDIVPIEIPRQRTKIGF
jgi:SpoVK/Ycf46/Vps4 family AAA+-type ATPase